MFVTLAARSLWQHRRRTLLLCSALATVTALMVLLEAFTGGLERTIIDTLTGLFTGHVNVEGFYKVTPGKTLSVINHPTQLREFVKQKVPEATQMVSRQRGWVRGSTPTGHVQLALSGVEITSEVRLRSLVRLIGGDWNSLRTPGTVVLFDFQARKLGVAVGDSMVLTASTLTGAYNTVDVRVGAIARDQSQLSKQVAFVSAPTLEQLLQIGPDTTGEILIYLRDIRLASTVQARLFRELSQAGFSALPLDPRASYLKLENYNRQDWTGQRLDVTTWENQAGFVLWAVIALHAVTGALVTLLLIIILIGMMNALWISIHERTREIGTLRAIGMSRARLVFLFVLESFFLSIAGVGVGAVVGVLGSLGLEAYGLRPPEVARAFLGDQLHLHLEPVQVLAPLTLIIVFITLGGVAPSWRAARIKPITAMQRME